VDGEASARGGGGEVGAEVGELDVGDALFIKEETASVIGDDEVDLVSEGEEHVEKAEGIGGAGGAGDPDDVAAAGPGGVPRVGRSIGRTVG
jgi:hypothetical protein